MEEKIFTNNIERETKTSLNILLEPCTSIIAKQNFEKTVKKGVSWDILNRSQESDLGMLKKNNSKVFKCWASSNDREWKKINKGDIVLFYTNKIFFHIARIHSKFQNRKLAKELWGTNDTGNIFEYMFIIEEDKPISLVYDPEILITNNGEKYSATHVIQREQVLMDKNATAMLQYLKKFHILESEDDSISDTIGGANAILMNNEHEHEFGGVNALYMNNRHESMMGTKELAEVCAQTIENMRGAKDTSFGIFGNWGRGKTHFANKLIDTLQNTDKDKWISIDYHAWKYQETPATWAYLHELFIDKYLSADPLKKRTEKNTDTKDPKKNFTLLIKRGFFTCIFLGINSLFWYVFSKNISLFFNYLFISGGIYFLFLIPKIKKSLWVKKIWKIFLLNINRIDINKFILIFLGVVVLFVFYKSGIINEKLEISFAGTSISITAILLWFYNNFLKIPKTMNGNSFLSSFNHLLGNQYEIEKSIENLFSVWFKNGHSKEKIILFVDDIDRCDEHKIIQIMDSLRIMLENDKISKHLVVMIAVDLRILNLAIRHKYNQLIIEKNKKANNASNDGLSLGKVAYEYLDKLFLIGIDHPDLSKDEIKSFYDHFTDGMVGTVKKNVSVNLNQKEAVSENLNQETKEEVSTILNQETKEEVSENINEEVGSQGYPWLQITPTEQLFIYAFFQEIQLLFPLTPRNMKVFHYRFVLAKNIIKMRYPELYDEIIIPLAEEILKDDLKFLKNKEIQKHHADYLIRNIVCTYFIKRHKAGGFMEDDKIYKEKAPKGNDEKSYFEKITGLVDYTNVITDYEKNIYKQCIDIVSPY